MQKKDLNIESSYSLYKKESTNPVEKKEFLQVANKYMKFLIKKMLEGEEVTLPAKLGTIFIQGTRKPLKFTKAGIPLLPPNWRKTKELWEKNPEARQTRKLVYCLNEETEGVVYKMVWSKNRVPIENKVYYNLILTRGNKRAIYSQIKQGKEYLIKT
jgi:hypothetical protein